MQQVQRATVDSSDRHCPRCLQPVPAKVARCPACRTPVQTTSRVLRLAIGFAGLIALIFAVALMYQTVRNEDSDNGDVPTEEVQKAPDGALFPANSPEKGSSEAPKPEKKPPLNEK